MAITEVTNHPNRNWRRRMHQHADAYVADRAASWPAYGAVVVLSRADLERHIRDAFQGGYACGRMTKGHQ
jgi:hypothetical protein